MMQLRALLGGHATPAPGVPLRPNLPNGGPSIPHRNRRCFGVAVSATPAGVTVTEEFTCRAAELGSNE